MWPASTQDNYVWTSGPMESSLHWRLAESDELDNGLVSNRVLWTFPISQSDAFVLIFLILLHLGSYLKWKTSLFSSTDSKTASQFSILFSWFPLHSSVQEIPICWTRSHTHTARWIQFSSNLRPTSGTHFRGSERKHINQKH